MTSGGAGLVSETCGIRTAAHPPSTTTWRHDNRTAHRPTAAACWTPASCGVRCLTRWGPRHDAGCAQDPLRPTHGAGWIRAGIGPISTSSAVPQVVLIHVTGNHHEAATPAREQPLRTPPGFPR